MFHNDAAPSPAQSIQHHALLRQCAFLDAPQLIEESYASEMQQALLPESSSSLHSCSTRETSTTAHILNGENTITATMRSDAIQVSRNNNKWIPLIHERNHRRCSMPPDMQTIYENFEDDDDHNAMMVLEEGGLLQGSPESSVGMARSLKRKRAEF